MLINIEFSTISSFNDKHHIQSKVILVVVVKGKDACVVIVMKNNKVANIKGANPNQTGQNSAKWGQTESKKFKWGQRVPNGT